MPLSARRQRFVNAYVGKAAGNSAEAARLAGYSVRTARQAGSRTLTFPDVQQAILDATKRSGLTVEGAISELALIAETHVEKVSANDKIKAIELFLKARGALRENIGESKVTVNIGFLSQSAPTDTNCHPRLTQSVTTLEVMGRGAALALRESEPVE